MDVKSRHPPHSIPQRMFLSSQERVVRDTHRHHDPGWDDFRGRLRCSDEGRRRRRRVAAPLLSWWNRGEAKALHYLSAACWCQIQSPARQPLECLLSCTPILTWDRKPQRERDRQTDRQKETDTQIETDINREGKRERHTERCRDEIEGERWDWERRETNR